MSNIFESGTYLDPEYNFLDKYVRIMYRGFWTPAKYEKLIKEQDVPYFFNEMGEIDQETIRRCILAAAMVEDKVKAYWPSVYNDFPQTIIGDVGALFGMSETTHRRSYHSLVENVKVNPNDVHKYPVLQGRIQYLSKHLENDPKIIGNKRKLKKLVLFTALVERVSLFTQFYILMSYAKANRGLKTMSSLQETTATEEMVHYAFGLDLINKAKEESPQIWDEYLVDLVEKNILDAYQAELNLIDWFFEKGMPTHLSKKEVVNFLGYNMNEVAKDLGLSIRFEYDADFFEEKNKWFIVKVVTPSEPDFFDSPHSGYASEEVEIDIDDIEF